MKDIQNKIEAHVKHMNDIIEVSYSVTSAMKRTEDYLHRRYLEELSGSVISVIEAQSTEFKDLHAKGLFDAEGFMEDHKVLLKDYNETVVNNRFRGRGIKEGFCSYLVTHAKGGRAIWDEEWNSELISKLRNTAELVMSERK